MASPKTTPACTASCSATATCRRTASSGRVRQSVARRAPDVRARIPAASAASTIRETGARRDVSCRCIGPPGAASCATRRLAASSAPDRHTTAVHATTISTTTSIASASRRDSAHLPRPQTLALVRGSAGDRRCASRGEEIYFHVGVAAARRGLRYQCAAPAACLSADRYRERENRPSATLPAPTAADHHVHRPDAMRTTCAFPPCREIAALVGCKPIVKRNWITLGGTIFSRVRARSSRSRHETARRRSRRSIVDESYMTVGRPCAQRRQAQGRRLHVPRDVAPRHRGVPRAAQEHRATTAAARTT